MVSQIFTLLFILGIPFFIYGTYYFVVGLFGYTKHNTYVQSPPKNRMVAIIAARNEAAVIGNLIESLHQQDYPQELMDIYVIPNNCTDDTEGVALAHGAKIMKCPAEVKSKGAALSQFFDYIFRENDVYDAFCVFDADNVVDRHFFTSMNNALVSGEKIAQGYRDSKNPDDSWISGCQSVFYWTLNRFLNLARHKLGWSATLNGTGFMMHADVVRKEGFNTFSLTEDIEFTTQCVIKGYRVAWVPEAITFDEHPLTFEQSWSQRKRWSTGTIQCFGQYSQQLLDCVIKDKNRSAMDMLMFLVAPFVQVLTCIYTVCSFIILGMLLINTSIWSNALTFSLAFSIGGVLCSVFFTAMVLWLEGKKIKQVNNISMFSFWFYLASWIPINILCFIKPIQIWEPIEHTQSVKISQMVK
ncbi:glycosyltransferase family 2 protein [Acetobacterium bakii]|uniref:Glycosyl transferase n=1 Tax=Acetobacterium bakii TaxID=52689 RepID=A0A0L6U402_9FIRM|nr:glycosyltransferase family 2 protein [Acetobacterium bakii]KNZ43067.1 glycosyl transferase [Acetobacterium bakii]